MKKMAFFIATILAYSNIVFARCDYPDDLDSRGRRCGGRAASVRKGGRLGGDDSYVDSYGRDRIYGKNNDPYDDDTSNNKSSYSYDSSDADSSSNDDESLSGYDMDSDGEGDNEDD